MVISGAVLGKLTAAFTSQEQKQYASAGAVAEEVLSSIRTVFAFGGEEQAASRLVVITPPAVNSSWCMCVGLGGGGVSCVCGIFYAVSAFRYERKLKEAKKIGAVKGIGVGTALGSIFFLLFVVYGAGFWFGGFLIQEGLANGGNVLTAFFSVVIGAFSIGQAGPNLQNLFTAAGAAGTIYETIDRVSLPCCTLSGSQPLGDRLVSTS